MGTWFAGNYPEHVRIAQSKALVQQLPWAILSNAGGALAVGVLAYLAGAHWVAALGVFTFGLLLLPIMALWSRRRILPVQAPLTQSSIWAISLYAGVLGAAWAMLAAVLEPLLSVELQVALVAGLFMLGVQAVSVFHFLPAACMAYVMPLGWAVASVIWASATQASGILLALVAAMLAGAVWLLKLNWDRFDRLVSLTADLAVQSDALSAQRAVADASVALKKRFLGAVSHDLRQPMHAISLYLGALSESPLPPSAREVVLDAKECAHHMNDMFQALLDVSRLDTQHMVPQVAPTSIGAVLALVNMAYQPLASAKGLTLRVRQSQDQVLTDPVMAERILMNVVSNAVRYTRHGKVLVGCRRRGAFLRVEVHDTGPGIEPSQQELMFEAFHRGPAALRESGGGLGLGLTVARRLAATAGAALTLKSCPGKGSCFCVEFSLAPGQSTELVPSQSPSQALPGAAVGLSNALVVVIDDDPTVLSAVVFLLREAGCEVVSGLSCDEAMDRLSTSSRAPDAIVCDYQLGEGRNGIEVIQLLRDEFNLDIPALLITGDTTGSWFAGLARLPGLPVMHKPLMADTFKQAVAGLLKKADDARDIRA